ncbi:MAG: tyrosine-type recombinase/integrase [Acidimicrobiales bacterium]|nr:tyrosine-type recombinase/integrase [Acidimicrobiales bacterium]
MTSPAGTRHPAPKRPKNDDVRGRAYLTAEEVDSLRKSAAAAGRHGHRDSTMILLAYTHALRVSELIRIRWDQVDLKVSTIHIKRLKGSVSGTHPLRRVEVQALKKLCPEAGSRRGTVFRNERGATVSRRSFHQIIARAGELAGFIFPVHPHMLRHGCGYKLTNEGHDTRSIQAWMGHKNIQHTVRYTELAPDRFERLKFWED